MGLKGPHHEVKGSDRARLVVKGFICRNKGRLFRSLNLS